MKKIGVIVLASISMLSVFSCKSEEEKKNEMIVNNNCGVYEAERWLVRDPCADNDNREIDKLKEGPLVIEIRSARKQCPTCFDVVARHNGIVIQSALVIHGYEEKDQLDYLELDNRRFKIQYKIISGLLICLYEVNCYNSNLDRWITDLGYQDLILRRIK